MEQLSLPELDSTDLKIIEALRADARQSLRDLAARVNRTTTPVFERIKRLEAAGIIRGYTAIIDDALLGRSFVVFCNVKLKQINREIHTEFANCIAELPEVTECYNISGAFDYMLRVEARNMAEYQLFLTERLGRLGFLASVESVFVMQEVKRSR